MESVSSTADWEKVFERVDNQFNKHHEITERLLKLVEEIAGIATMAPSSPEMEAFKKLIVDRLGGDP